MRTAATSEHTLTLQLHASEIQWKKAGKEFIWQGELYDVRSIRHHAESSSCIIVCVHDTLETELISLLRHITLRKSPAQNHKNLPITAFYPNYLAPAFLSITHPSKAEPTQGECKSPMLLPAPYIGRAAKPPCGS